MRSDFESATVPNDINLLGTVFSCRGSQADVLLSTTTRLPRATVGKFVFLKHLHGGSIGMINEIFVVDENENRAGNVIAKIDLVAELASDNVGDVCFKRGVREYPAIGDEVVILDQEALRVIQSSFSRRPMQIGRTRDGGDAAVFADADSLLSKHFAILGSTGVGKSSAAAVLLNGLIRARPDVRIFLLDVHNEYSSCFAEKATTIGPQNLKLPFWLFNFEEFVDVIYGGRPAVPEELDILMELIPIARGNYANLRAGVDRSSLARKQPKQTSYTVDTPTPYVIQDLISLIDDRMGKLENRATRMVHHRLSGRIEAIRNDPRYSFMFENANVGGDTMASVLTQLFAGNLRDQSVTVLQMAGFPDEAVDALVCVVLRLAFELGLWSEASSPLLIVCEEAHRFAAADHSGGFAPTRRGLSRIAKEGRKYGVHLGLVSQRPAELDPTIVSQCSSLFLMRMTNERDQRLLRSAVSDAAANLLSLIPSLGTGEVVAVGEAMSLPMRFSFDVLPGERLPQSEHAGTSTAQSDAERGTMIERAVDRWRRATSATDATQQDKAIPLTAAIQATAHSQSALTRGLQASLAADNSIAARKKF